MGFGAFPLGKGILFTECSSASHDSHARNARRHPKDKKSEMITPRPSVPRAVFSFTRTMTEYCVGWYSTVLQEQLAFVFNVKPNRHRQMM
mmetsp:Transcript_1844/g.4053  ORF Transcript_1844/g.4053 Transcript_1844/m.4053 type:complete len:90 (+) Transcript_1844:2008-2277(+)